MDVKASKIAAAIGEPARAKMLYCLMDKHARTSTELAVVAEVSPSTASIHLQKIKTERLVKLEAQGKHRYYSLAGKQVADVLEGLSVLAGARRVPFRPNTPNRLRAARTCYDHVAGSLGVRLHDRFFAMGWLNEAGDEYEVSEKGIREFEQLGVNVEEARGSRRKFAFGCLDWSERRPHLGGALGAQVLGALLQRRWVARDLDSRALEVTRVGEREMAKIF